MRHLPHCTRILPTSLNGSDRSNGAKMKKRKPQKPNKTTSLKAAFDAAHKDGMDAIQRGDYDAFGNAIDRERKIIDDIDTTIKPAPKRRK